MSRSPEIERAVLAADERVVWTEDVLRFGDTDANGHINNAAFAVFCESGRVNYFETMLRRALGPGGSIVVAGLAIDFRAELFYPGRVRSGTWIRHVGRTSVGFGQALFDDADRLVATAEAVTVCLDGATRRPAEHPPSLLNVLRRMVRG